ncbi:MAG: sialate O-acetylesterase [Phycisphaeraceae bacterium]
MKVYRLIRGLTALLAWLLVVAGPDALAAGKPLKVYILAGQSNMEGHAMTRTFDYIGDDPETAPLLKIMVDETGKPVVAEGVWVSNYTGFFDNNGVTTGKLTAGFGARQNPNELGDKIGPEFTFGLVMDKAYDGPVLIIKTAWGGKSLHTDFRPPSAGPYRLSAWQREHYPKQQGHGIPKDFEQWKIDKEQATGVYYRKMIEHVKQVLADPGKACPAYDAEAGYELAGFVWFQGWNDMVDSHTYPHKLGDQRFDLYTELLSAFIRDVRKDLKAPDMPFVIGVMGVGGIMDENTQGYEKTAQVVFRKAMAAPADRLKNVAAVQTAPSWDTPLGEIERKREAVRAMAWKLKTKNQHGPNADGSMSEQEQRAYLDAMRAELITPEDEAMWERGASNAGYHYLGSAKTMALIGQAFAEALLKME